MPPAFVGRASTSTDWPSTVRREDSEFSASTSAISFWRSASRAIRLADTT
jgi:hypothetical protein